MPDKICPLMMVGPVETNSNCKGDRCAWWDKASKACCIASAADSLQSISESLDIMGRDD